MVQLIIPQIEQNEFECKTQSWGYLSLWGPFVPKFYITDGTSIGGI